MTIEALMAVVPPPDRPCEPFVGPWSMIESELGSPLPQDYKDYAQIYGSGYFLQFLQVDIPRTGNPNIRLEKQVVLTSEMFAQFEGADRPYPLWPAPGGLMPFGGTDNGDTLFWLRRGAPDEWPVVVADSGGWAFELLECGMTDFLAGLARGEIRSEIFPDDLLPADCLFAPTTPWVWVPVTYRASARMRLKPGPPNPWRWRR